MHVRKLFILRSDVRIAPFGDPVGECPIVHAPLREWQARAAALLGAEAVSIADPREIGPGDHPCLLARDDLFFTADTLREFVRLAARRGASTRFAARSGTAYFRTAAPFQEGDDGERVTFPLELRVGPTGGASLPATLVDLGEHDLPVALPAHMKGGREVALPAVVRPILQLRHPVHLLCANLLAVNVRFARLAGSRVRQALLAARAGSRRPVNLLARMNRVGAGCDVHPTARLEGAELGRGVRVGAHALVRMSSVGDGCDVGDGAVVRHCVLGAGTVLFDNLDLNFVLTYPEVFLIHGPYNLSVFGRAAAMFATILTDFRLDGKPIRLEVDGQLREFPFPFVGSFVGHRTRVGGGSIIAPGRLIPNDLLVFPSPRSVLASVDPLAPRSVPLAIEDGRLKVITRAGAGGVTAVG